MGPYVPLSYTSDGVQSRFVNGGGGDKTAIILCTLNAHYYRCRLCRWHRSIPYSSLFNSSINRGHGPAPLCPLSYASEQHATEDLEKKGREKSMHAYHVGLCMARSRQKRALAPAANEESENV